MRRGHHIILIQSDSMDGRAMGCAGHPAAVTPNIDRLAERGTIFETAYCNSPQCCPSRSSMWSGQHVHRCRGWNNYKGLEAGDRTFVDDLAEAGYQTSILGRTDHLSGRHSLWNRVDAWIRHADIDLPRTAAPDVKVSDSESPETHGGDWRTARLAVERLGAMRQGDPPQQ